MEDASEMPFRRGRGARSNPANRFTERQHIEDPAALDADERRQVETTYTRDPSRSILAKNDSPDIPFTYSLNPYRGCEHGCSYCLSGDTLILMGDGRAKTLRDVQVGDVIYGTVRQGWYRRYVRTRVLDHWSAEKPAYRITLADGTELVASGDHRFLTERGWKFVTGREQGRHRRPHLTLNNALMGIGTLQAVSAATPPYKQGYLCGMIRGDGHLGFYQYDRPGRQHGNQWQFRLALTDDEGLERTASYLDSVGIPTHAFCFQEATIRTAALSAIRTHARSAVKAIEDVIDWPETPSTEWRRGFLAGIFDAEGSYSGGTLRISNTDETILSTIEAALQHFDFSFVREKGNRRERSIQCVRLLGGLVEHLRFFHRVDPAIRRKVDIEGQALKSAVDLQVVCIESLEERRPMYDITTATGDFIANGVVSHNCYARPTHEYLGFSAGIDFETRILVKENAPALLSETFQQSSWTPEPVAMSGVTDPYQPAEREKELTRGCLEVFLRHRNPVSIITKSGLIRRDVDLLAELAARGLVHVYLSITSLDDDIAGAMEPRAARPQLRLQAVETLAEAGVPVGVHIAPVVPGLTDEELPAILQAAADAGAQAAGYQILRLPGAVENLFVDWLETHFPHRTDRVLRRVRSLREGKLNETAFGDRMRGHGIWADTYRQLFQAAVRKTGLDGSLPPLSTDAFRRLKGGQRSLFTEPDDASPAD